MKGDWNELKPVLHPRFIIYNSATRALALEASHKFDCACGVHGDFDWSKDLQVMNELERKRR
jgi:hypothetical protein